MAEEEEVVSILAGRKKAIAFVNDDSDSDDASPPAPTMAGSAAAPPQATSASSAAAAPAASSKAAKGGKKGGKGGKAAAEEEDWEALLEAEGLGGSKGAEEAAGGQSKAAEKKKKKAAAAAASAAGGEGGDAAAEEGAAAAAAAAASPKAAGGGASSGGAAKAPAPSKPLSKVAQLALERKAREEQEEARRREEEALARAELEAEMAAAAEEERKEKERKAKKADDKRAKKEAAIREGTYLTKKQREEAAKLLARLDAMKASGMSVEGFEAKRAAAEAAVRSGDAQEAEEGEGEEGEGAAAAAAAAAAAGGKRPPVYDSRKKKPSAGGGGGGGSAAAAAASAAPEEAAPAAAAAQASAALVPEEVDDWEAAADAVVEAEAAAAAVAAPPPTLLAGGGGAAAAAAAGAPQPGSSASATSSSSSSSAAPPPAPAASTLVSAKGLPLEQRIALSRERRAARLAEAQGRRSRDNLRSPICVVLGHVDTGKTSLLDKIRRTNVQEGEAGGITQQIGATYFPMEALKPATDKLNRELNLEYKVPGLLVVDTPGHEQFTNLRSRGSSLCDIAVLVVDIMVGLERQTLESLELLRQRKTPFIVALNKVDRMYGWKALPNAPIRESLASQADYSVEEFERRTAGVLGQLQGQGFNAKLYYENDDFRRVVSVVPTSAHSGEGVPDLLMLLVQLTQVLMSHRIMLCDVPQASVLEVKTIDGLGTTVDIVLVNGSIREGDTIVACGMAGPIVTTVRALLTPPHMREMRVKSDYVHHKCIQAAMGVKVVAADLELAVAGTELLIMHPEDELEDLKAEVMGDFDKIMKGFARSAVGVYVQSSTLGSLEALLEYLRSHKPPVPVANVGIGPLHKKDVVVASVMLERRKEYATILAFDVKITPEAEAEAEGLGVRIFRADIIYHLTDQFSRYLGEQTKARQASVAADAVFPCVLKVIPTAIFNKKDPIVIGVDVVEGKLRLGTPLCVVLAADKVFTAGGLGAEREAAAAAAAGGGGSLLGGSGKNILVIGRVASMEVNHVAVTEVAPGGQSVCIKIEQTSAQSGILYGRHFDHTNPLYSHISRHSIDILKEHFVDQLTQPVMKTIKKLKETLGVL